MFEPDVHIVLPNNVSPDSEVSRLWDELLMLSAISEGAYGSVEGEWFPWVYGVWMDASLELDCPDSLGVRAGDRIKRILHRVSLGASYPQSYMWDIIVSIVKFLTRLMNWVIEALERVGFDPFGLPKTLVRGEIKPWAIYLYYQSV